MAIKLIVCDIDGTLVRDDTKEIPSENVKALKAIQEKGILVTIASGRVPSGLYGYGEELGILDNCKYVIGSNGGAVMNLQTKEYIYDEFISQKDTNWTMKIIKEMGREFYLAPLDDNLAYVSSDKVIKEDTFLFRHTEIKPLILDWTIIPQMRKVVVSCSDEEGQNWLRQKIAVSKTLRTEITGYGYIEVIPKNVNKWQGIIKLVEILKTKENIQIDLDEIMCFGDQMNDYEMIKNSNFGIALANAVDEIKEVADEVTEYDNNHAGIAHYLYTKGL